MQSISLLFKVLWSPGEALFFLSKNPKVLTPILFLTLFSIVTGAVLVTKLDSAELTMRAIERSSRGSNLSDEQKAQLRRQMGSPVVKVFTFVSAVVGALLVVLIVAGIYFALFTMLGREGSFKAFLSITAYAFVPRIFSSLAAVLSAYVVPPSSLMPDELGSLSPAVFLDRDAMSTVVFTAVNTIDLVTIWVLILLWIGYGFVTRKSLSKVSRAAAILGVFMLYVALRLVSAAVRGI
jgi:Yip1-like protein